MDYMAQTQSKIYFTRDQYEYLAKLFPAPVIAPGADMQQLQYSAGAHQVVQKVRQLVTDLPRVLVV